MKVTWVSVMSQRRPVQNTDDRSQTPLAFLVDGDNASPKLLQEMLAEASKYGSVKVRRVYGDWTSKQMESWRRELQEHAIIPIQQFPNVSGKNATDSALIIEAMDLLHSGTVEGFCIVSSDSDYSRLAMRIREEGLFIMAIGEKKTHDSLRKACDVFVLTDNLKFRDDVKSKGRPKQAGMSPKKAMDARKILIGAFDDVVGEDGYALMASLGAQLRKLDPGFDPRSYGASKLVNLIENLPKDFKIERRGDGGSGVVLVRRT